MDSAEFFHILDTVDSTNNYAMAALHAGMAKHGMAWFAKEQTAGKGQRGRAWVSEPNENIILSIAIEPLAVFSSLPFLFNAVVSNSCYNFLYNYINDNVKIKWPNDLYCRDRKTGGILIENIYQGSSWKWAVVGIGINVNQTIFPGAMQEPISIKMITGKNYDSEKLARELYEIILHSFSIPGDLSFPKIIKSYNDQLFRINEQVKLRKKNIVFETTITGVNEYGQLLTVDTIPRHFEFGEVEWVI